MRRHFMIHGWMGAVRWAGNQIAGPISLQAFLRLSLVWANFNAELLSATIYSNQTSSIQMSVSMSKTTGVKC